MKHKVALLTACLTICLLGYADGTINIAQPVSAPDQGWTFANKEVTIVANGEYVLTGNTTEHCVSVAANVKATITLNNVTIRVDYFSPLSLSNDTTGAADVTLKLIGNNTLITSEARYAGLTVEESAHLTIENAEGQEGALFAQGGGVIASSGTVGFGSAGIGSGDNRAAGFITIRSGIITAQGGAMAAGIGSGYQSDLAESTQDTVNGGTIIITGGVVKASGGKYAAGIGGGLLGVAKSITISGGNVTATGGEFAAGIGGGGYGSGGLISLNGGNVTATGGAGGAGVGGGYLNNGGTILIDGTTLTAIGGTYAAGIGSGEASTSAGTVTIRSGVVLAAATVGNVAGIGGSAQNADGTISISGGTVFASGPRTGIGGTIQISGGAVIANSIDEPLALAGNNTIILTNTLNATPPQGMTILTGDNIRVADIMLPNDNIIDVSLFTDLTINNGAELVIPNGIRFDANHHAITVHGNLAESINSIDNRENVSYTSFQKDWLYPLDDHLFINQPICPNVSIINYEGNALIEGTHYALSYLNNETVGQASVHIAGLEPFTTDTNLTFNILPNPLNFPDTLVKDSSIRIDVLDTISYNIVEGGIRHDTFPIPIFKGDTTVEVDIHDTITVNKTISQPVEVEIIKELRDTFTKEIEITKRDSAFIVIETTTGAKYPVTEQARVNSYGTMLLLENLQPGKPFEIYTIKGLKFFTGIALPSGTFSIYDLSEATYILYHEGNYSKFRHTWQ